MANRQRDAKLEKFWRDAIRKCEQSGLTIVGFCKQEGLKASAYHYWRREIGQRDQQVLANGEGLDTPIAHVASLVPVRLIDDRASAGVEIVARNGWVVRVGEDTSTEHLRRVLELVRELA